LHDSTTNQVNFGLRSDTGGKEGETPIGSIARVNPKVALAEHAICQANDHGEFGCGRKGIQPEEDLTLGETGSHQVDPTLVRW
jgi:hypothetical protein